MPLNRKTLYRARNKKHQTGVPIPKRRIKRMVGMVLCFMISMGSIGLINYISYSIKNKRVNQLMICGIMGMIGDMLIVQVIKTALTFGIVMYLKRNNNSLMKCKKLLLDLIPISLIERLR